MPRKNRGRPVSGILLLDKPLGESSNASLQKAKRLLNAAKAGHTGSLDPLATGVLPLCFGEATKISQFLLDSDKAYRTRIRLGVRTESGDSAGNVIREQKDVCVDEQALQNALEQFRGDIRQMPPMYSALKKDGVPLYRLARQGKTVEREARNITVHSLTLLEFSGREAELEIHCSKGTYIRAIADDLGEVLGCGAHVVALRRIKAGPFLLAQCHTHQQLETALVEGGPDRLDSLLVPADLAVQELPEVQLPGDTARLVKQGQAVIVRHLPSSGLVRLYAEGAFIGIGSILDDGRVAPKRLMTD